MPLPGSWLPEDVLTLYYIRGVNSALIKSVIDKYESLDAILESRIPPELSMAISQTELFGNSLEAARDKAFDQMDLCDKFGVDMVTLWDSTYPALLKEIPLPPVVLFVKGKLQDRASIAVSMVGKRECTSYGSSIAKQYANFFAKSNLIVVSGLAKGVDSISHEATIEAAGITYAVIASGIDKISPRYAAGLADRIEKSGGAVISEYPCGTIARLPYFPQRNRIISGISKATVVIESATKGGSLITAKFAFEQFREVYAVPGNITSPESMGCNNLIKNNVAKAVQSPDEILIDLGIESGAEPSSPLQFKPKPELSGNEALVYDTLNSKAMHVDELAIKSGLDISELSVLLLNMEFKGLLKSLPGNHYQTD